MSDHGAGDYGSGDHGHAPGLFPVPGDGVLARRGDLILLCSLEVSQVVDDLLDALEQIAAAGGDGRQFTDAIADTLEASDATPSVLAFGPAGPGLAVTVSGGAWADVTTAEGIARLEAGHPRMLLRGALRSPVSGVRGGLSPGDNGAASTDRFSRLDAGTVRAGGLSFYQAGLAASDHGAGGGPVRLGKAQRAKPLSAQTPAAAARLAGVPVAEIRDQGAPAAPDAAETPEPAPQLPAPDLPAPDLPAPDLPATDLPAAEVREYVPEAEPPLAEVPAEAAPAAESAMPQAPAPSSPIEPTAAWVSPDVPEAASQRQATELWSPPPAEPSAEQSPAAQGTAFPPGQMLPSGPGTAEDLEREVTAPPEPFEPAPAVQPFQQAAPFEPAQPFEAVLLLEAGSGSGIDVPARQPLSKVKDMPPGSSSYVSAGPIIQGVYCKNGHFDDPEALFCAICGISMNQQTLVPRPGERPPLGVVLLDDGSVFQLDSDYVVGREPSLDSSVAAGKARPLRVADDSGIVSRVHARVQLDGWRVLVTDLGSANGTRVLLPGQPADQQLVPQVPIVLATGSQVDLGGRGFRYESHRGR